MYCQHCGAQAQENARFCASCGRAIVIAAVPASDNRVARHVRLLAILWMARAGLRLLLGVATILVGRLFLPFLLGNIDRLPLGGLVPAIVNASGWFVLLMAIPSLAVGIGLLNHEPWARPLALVMGFLSLLSPVLGTALGIYTLWVLLPSRADEEYQKLARAA
ncbi:MAG: zinc ribbon domain-containing protein [Acidobacteria bacterium]|nr:zinc ribbon domain-containing protein [Acidobacteriota bacterium]